eukprot:gb/GECG01006918.1/.p1 GENE.gb/GECG01006918.1/~~gb/GECG01006918.1/.p1  ORF type:complete len:136 (+),score=16.52 gb/GECG01006918.1/:1-408(+)
MSSQDNGKSLMKQNARIFNVCNPRLSQPLVCRVSSLHENDATDEQLSSSPVLSVMQSMKSYGRTPGTQASTTADRSFHTDSLSSSRNRDSQFATGLQGLSIQEEEPRKKMGFNLSEGKGSESESESDDGLMFEAD